MHRLISILIVEDQPIYADGLKTVLETDPRLEITGICSNGREALDFLQKEKVDVILLDINMPVMNGMETMEALSEKHTEIDVIMLTAYDENSLIMRFLDLGVSGYLLKDAGAREIREAIHTVAGGGTHYGLEVMKKITEVMRSRRHPDKDSAELTSREKEIMRLVVQEFTAQEIADKLFIAKDTVDTHRKNIREKLNVRNTAGMVREAIRRGWVID